MLVGNYAHQSDGGRLPDGVGLEVAADRLGATSHEIETQLGSWTVGFERLGEIKQRVEIAGHRPVIDPRVEITKIDDALWRLLPVFFEQLFPVLERFLAQRKRVGSIELEIVSRSRHAAAHARFAKP